MQQSIRVHPMTKLDLTYVRSQFPAFSEPLLSSHAFFENAGGSYPCRPVVDRLHRFYTERKVQPYGPYPGAQAGGAEMDEARTRLAALMGVAPEELSFGPSTSANTFVLAQAVRLWLRGSPAAIVVTNQDHEANSGVWRRLADEGIEVREWTWQDWCRCWPTVGSGWWPFRIVPTSSQRLTRWPRFARWPVQRGRGRWWTAYPMHRTACLTLARWGAIAICFRPIRPTARIRGSC
jgi:hypothetical protein